MLDILTPEGALSFIIYRVSLIREMVMRVILTFCGFPWVETSTAGRVYDLCVYYMTGAPEGSPKVVLCGFFYGSMEKPGIEPATPGLQGIALIHYTFFVAFLGINQFHRFGLR